MSAIQLALRVMGRYANWWNIPGGSYDTYAHKLKALHRHCEAVGRAYDGIVKACRRFSPNSF